LQYESHLSIWWEIHRLDSRHYGDQSSNDYLLPLTACKLPSSLPTDSVASLVKACQLYSPMHTINPPQQNQSIDARKAAINIPQSATALLRDGLGINDGIVDPPFPLFSHSQRLNLAATTTTSLPEITSLARLNLGLDQRRRRR
jgi:hypothetical protein